MKRFCGELQDSNASFPNHKNYGLPVDGPNFTEAPSFIAFAICAAVISYMYTRMSSIFPSKLFVEFPPIKKLLASVLKDPSPVMLVPTALPFTHNVSSSSPSSVHVSAT